MTEMPSYEDMLSHGRTGSAAQWKRLVLALVPGEPTEVDITNRNTGSVRQMIRKAAQNEGVSLHTRFIGGRLYVVRLRDEDTPDA